MSWTVKRAIYCLLLPCLMAEFGQSCATDTGTNGHAATTVWDEVKRFGGNRPDMMDAYQQLHTRSWGEETAAAAQMSSMTDAMLGRYEQASQEMEAAFNTKPTPPPSCPVSLGAGSFRDWLTDHAGKFDLVMVNEAHNLPASRALIYEMLPVMRRLGFSVLALEALPDRATTDWINRNGYVPDESSYGYYLREPLEADLVREARRLGFTLANYDVISKTREQDEAKNLAQVAKEHPGEKVFVVAGYDHIRRMNGRMAELLPKFYQGPYLSIDQLGYESQGVSVCTANGSPGTGLSVLTAARWEAGGKGTDITVWRTEAYVFNREATKGGEWLSLGGERRRYRFSTKDGCGKQVMCLVEARYANEPASAVPADRYLALDTEQFASLYLRNGRYVVTYTDADGTVVRSNLLTARDGGLVH